MAGISSTLSERNAPLRAQKRLLQFNDLPFFMGEISDQTYTATFKGETQAYTNAAHGGYFPTLGEFGKLETSEFSATVQISFKEIDCEDKLHYARFIKRQLAKSGKLWAVQSGNEIIYANARVTSINEDVESIIDTDVLSMGLTFELIDGYWVIASTTRTFLCDYCPAKFQNIDPYYCYDVTELVGQCDETGTSRCFPCLTNLFHPVEVETCDAKPLCNYTHVELASMLGARCPNQYYIQYSCELEEDYFCYDVSWGKKYRLYAGNVNNQNVTRVNFCSKTDLPTDFVRIRLSGNWTNGKIIIRHLKPTVLSDPNYADHGATFMDDKYLIDQVVIGNSSQPFNVGQGVVTLGYGIKAYYSYNDKHPDQTIIEIPASQISRTNAPYFQLNPGINVFEIMGNNYGEDAFAYFQPIELTF